MNKFMLLLVLLSSVLCCGRDTGRVKRTVADGVETVFNGIDPYIIKGEPGVLRLEKDFSIDTEDEARLKTGLTDIETFDVDPAGNIYLIQWNTKADYIHKFDKDGNWLKSFCRQGQGPGEIEYGGTVMITASGKLIAKDPSQTKFLIYSQDGMFLRETRLPRILGIDHLFEDGSYLVSWQDDSDELKYYINYVAVCDSEFEKIRELGTHQFPNSQMGENIIVGQGAFIYGASKDRIFVANSAWGYEIRVFSLNGKLLRKIRKDYRPVPIDEEFKKAFLARIPNSSQWKKLYRFAADWPPFRFLFTDDEGRLYVMTREPGPDPGEFMYDIFSAEGVFIGRTSLGNSGPSYPRTARASNGRMYSLNEKENGYKELVVYRMIWEDER
ncbi:MAG: 6-bladed beta-propeller [Candidatus Aminicenantes bacterium]|nr:6-bladed beta-propeller [Candidatus Aminicenantes bacterium]